MKKITRALAAVLLCALLMLCAPFAAAMEGVTGAQVQIWLADGSTQALPVQIVTTSLGDVVYWVDQTVLTEEQRAALTGGVLQLVNENGEIVWQQPLAMEGQTELVSDMPMQVANPENPEDACTVMLGDWIAAPATAEEADMVLAQFGFATPEPYVPEETPEPTEEPTPEPTEEPTPEPTPEPTEEPTPEPTPEPTSEPEPEPVVPDHVPLYVTADGTAEVYEGASWSSAVTLEVNDSDVLAVEGYMADADNAIWWAVRDYRTGLTGYIRSDLVIELDNDTAARAMAAIDGEKNPTVPEETESPAIPEETESPVVPEETEAPVITPPQFVVPNQDLTNLRSAPYMSEATEFVKVNAGDLLIVDGYEVAADGEIWWHVTDYRTQGTGYVISGVVS